MPGTAPPPSYCLTYYQASRRYLFLDLALDRRRTSFMVSSIITTNDGSREAFAIEHRLSHAVRRVITETIRVWHNEFTDGGHNGNRSPSTPKEPRGWNCASCDIFWRLPRKAISRGPRSCCVFPSRRSPVSSNSWKRNWASRCLNAAVTPSRSPRKAGCCTNVRRPSQYEFLRTGITEHWSAMVPGNHPLAERESLTPQNLKDVPLLFPLRTPVHNLLLNWFGQYADQGGAQRRVSHAGTHP